MNQITITKVVTRNILADIYAKIQNFFGTNLTYYELMIQKATEEIAQEIKEKKIQLKWFRYETTQLTNGAVMLMFYGEKK